MVLLLRWDISERGGLRFPELRVPVLIAAPLLGLICMGIADYSACSIREARVLHTGRLPGQRTWLRSGLCWLQRYWHCSWTSFRSLLRDLFRGICNTSLPGFIGPNWLGRSSDVDTWTQSHDFRLPFSSRALSEPCFGDDELLTGRCQKWLEPATTCHLMKPNPAQHDAQCSFQLSHGAGHLIWHNAASLACTPGTGFRACNAWSYKSSGHISGTSMHQLRALRGTNRPWFPWPASPRTFDGPHLSSAQPELRCRIACPLPCSWVVAWFSWIFL